MSSYTVKTPAQVALVALFLILLISAALWSGYVTATLWRWFFAEPYGLRVLTLPQGMGISIFANWLLRGVAQRSHGKEPRLDLSPNMILFQPMADVFIISLVALAMGFVVRMFM